MKNYSTIHCHSSYVDGKSTAEDQILAAIEKGFISIGFSEHGPQTFDPRCALAEDKIIPYINEIKSLQEKYKDRIRVHLGIEMDAFSTARAEMYEYVLGAAHYFNEGPDFCGVDGSGDLIIKYRDEKFGGDGIALAVHYYNIVGEFALRIRPHAFAHFDLMMIRNRDGSIYDASSPKVIDAQYAALEKLLSVDTLLEVNTGGMARSKQPYPYPELHVLRRWREMGGRVILGSDCHHSSSIDFAYPEAIEYMKHAGFRTAWRLGTWNEPQFIEYNL